MGPDTALVAASVALLARACNLHPPSPSTSPTTSTSPAAALSPPTYALMFPLLRHVLTRDAAGASPLATAAFNVVALHCSPDAPAPQPGTLPLLFLVLGAQGPGHAAKILPLAQACCATLPPDNLAEALDGARVI